MHTKFWSQIVKKKFRRILRDVFLWKSQQCRGWTALRILKVASSLGDHDDDDVTSKPVALSDVMLCGLLATLFPEYGSVLCKITKAETFSFAALITQNVT